MINLQELTAFFGWMLLINVCLLFVAFFMILFFKNIMIKFHKKFFDIGEEDLKKFYFEFLLKYNVLVIVFNLTPYIVLRLMA